VEGEWLTYEQAAERLNVSPEAIRQKAIRGRWRRTIGNDKRALVQLPDGWPDAVRTPSERPNKHPVRMAFGRVSETLAVRALEAHVQTLKEQLAAAEARAEKIAADSAADLSAERAAFAAKEAALAGDLAAERARTEKAIEAFASLAERLDALAAERARPWWRRLVARP
jgi:hypothetical protein